MLAVVIAVVLSTCKVDGDTNSWEEYYGKTLTLRSEGRLREALDCGEQALSMKGRSAMVVCTVGDIMKKMSINEKGWKTLSKCVKELRNDIHSDDEDLAITAEQQLALNTFGMGDIIRKSDISRKFIEANSEITTSGNSTTWRGLTSVKYYQTAADVFNNIIKEDINDQHTSNAQYGYSVAQHNIGSALSTSDPSSALAAFLLAIKSNSGQFESYTNAAQLLYSLNKVSEAFQLHNKALTGLASDPTKDAHQCAERYLDFLFQDDVKNCTALLKAKSMIAKMENAKRVLSDKKHKFQVAYCQLQQNTKTERALSVIRKLADADASGESAYNMATNLLEVATVSKKDVIIPLFRQSLSQRKCDSKSPPDSDCAYTWNNLGISYEKSGLLLEAENSYKSSLNFKPNFPRAATNLASIIKQTGNGENAEENLLSVIKQNPEFGEAYNNIAVLYSETGQLRESLWYYEKAVQLLSTDDSLLNYAHAAKRVCDWKNYNLRIHTLSKRLQKDKSNTTPENIRILHLLSYPYMSEKLIQKVANQRVNNYLLPFSRELVPDVEKLFQFEPEWRTISIISSDMKHHPVGYALTSLLVGSNDDDDGIDIDCFSVNLQKSDDITDLLLTGCSSFININHSPATQVDLNVISSLQQQQKTLPSILIDVNGNTQGGAELLFGAIKQSKIPHKPSTVGYLGYPFGSQGVNDYFISDVMVLPPSWVGSQITECVVYLTPTYMGGGGIDEVIHSDDAADTESEIVLEIINKRSRGIPTACYTGQPYKLSSDLIDIWVNLLESVPSLILILSEWDDSASKNNLIREANSRGIVENIYFIPYFDKQSYRDTHKQVCSVMLDTPINYGGHVSTLDSIISSIPVITMWGSTVRTRASAAIMSSLGLPSLVAHSLREYELIAGRYLSNQELLSSATKSIQKSHENNLNLFNTKRYKKSFNNAMTIIKKLHRLGMVRHVVPDDNFH